MKVISLLTNTSLIELTLPDSAATDVEDRPNEGSTIQLLHQGPGNSSDLRLARIVPGGSDTINETLTAYVLVSNDITFTYVGSGNWATDDMIFESSQTRTASGVVNRNGIIDASSTQGILESSNGNVNIWAGAETDAPAILEDATATASTSATETAFTFPSTTAPAEGAIVYVSSANNDDVSGVIASSPAPTATTATVTWDATFTDAATSGYILSFRDPRTFYILT